MSFRSIVTGAAAISGTTGALTRQARLSAILVLLDAAPTTSENLIVTLDSVDGAAYDTVLYTKDLIGVTSLAVTDINLPLLAGDIITFTYANTDTNTVGIRQVMT